MTCVPLHSRILFDYNPPGLTPSAECHHCSPGGARTCMLHATSRGACCQHESTSSASSEAAKLGRPGRPAGSTDDWAGVDGPGEGFRIRWSEKWIPKAASRKARPNGSAALHPNGWGARWRNHLDGPFAMQFFWDQKFAFFP